MRKLPASFFYILAGVNFWINGGSKKKIEALTEFPETLYFRELDPSHPRSIFFPFFPLPDLVGILMADVGRKALSAAFLLPVM